MKSIIILITVFAGITFSQTAKYFDAPFGGGGGYVPGWYIPNVDPINEQLKIIGIPELSKSGFYTSGGAGYIYIGFLKNLRVGGMGFAGSSSEKSTLLGVNREAVYSIGGGGISAEYTLPFIKNIGVSVGTILGFGGIDIELYKNSGSFGWDEIWNSAGTANSNNVSRTISRNFFIVAPTLNVDIPLYRFVSFRLGGGYQITFGGDWEVDNGQSISGVPSDLGGNSFFIQSGIFIGFFSF